MNASITFRFPGVAVSEQHTNTSAAASPAPDDAVDISDESLIAQICRGNKEGLSVLFRRYARVVRGIAYRVLRDRSEADDLLQDIFLLIHRLCGNFDPSKGSARFWILQMTYRRALCRRRFLTTRHFYQRLDVDDLAEELPDPRAGLGNSEDTLDRTFGVGRSQQAFASLSENQQQTLRLYFVDGYSLDEIAEKLGQSQGNVKHHYFRGIERLRRELLGTKSEPGSETGKHIAPLFRKPG